MERIIGYTLEKEEFKPLYAPEKGSIVTHAFILCGNCGTSVYPAMGPRYKTICLACHESSVEDLEKIKDNLIKKFGNF
jgi:hypothetical protein